MGTPQSIQYTPVASRNRSGTGAPAESYDGQFGITPTGGTQWNESGRRTAINGLVEPHVVGARAGSIERWRFIHAGVRDSIRLGFRKLDPVQAAATPGKGRKTRELFIRRTPGATRRCSSPVIARTC